MRCCTRYFSSSLIACVHFIETLAILAVQGACLIQAIASSTLAIVLEAYKLVGRRKLIATSCSVATSTFDTEGSACTPIVDAWDCAILELSVLRVDAHRVILLTGEDVVFALVNYPGEIIWVGSGHIVARVRAGVGRCSRCGGVDESEGSDGDLHVCFLFLFYVAERCLWR